MLNKHIKVGVMHKDISSRERKNTFNSANKGEYKYLVATDLASRGIDIDGVDCVISYGLPNDDI
ncbi:hypothetical protein FACS189459_5500 [Bacilli bacterium]|nr:hypothetical protein FACS189459_5500 [Bacilli bacterium]